MITRIEIDGFKSFYNFAVDLRPFQVLIGANGAGKSNLFDAIMLLSYLASEKTIYDALRKVRGDGIDELFAIQPDGSRSDMMVFAVEVKVPKSIQDSAGKTGKLVSQNLRYEIVIEKINTDGLEHLQVTHERIEPVEINKKHLFVFQGRSSEDSKSYDYTSLSRQTSIFGKNATVYAVHQELLSWQTYLFEPDKIREPGKLSELYGTPIINFDGSNLAAVLYWLKNHPEYKSTFHAIDLAISKLVGVSHIDVRAVKEIERLYLEATSQQQGRLSAELLSDGTLRMLALLTLVHDPRTKGVICFEEPENGVHAHHLQRMIAELASLATNISEPAPAEAPLRQVLVSTHSQLVLSWVKPEDILFVYTSHRGNLRPTWIGQIMPDREKKLAEQRYPVDLLKRYLNPAPLEEQQALLDQILQQIMA